MALLKKKRKYRGPWYLIVTWLSSITNDWERKGAEAWKSDDVVRPLLDERSVIH